MPIRFIGLHLRLKEQRSEDDKNQLRVVLYEVAFVEHFSNRGWFSTRSLSCGVLLHQIIPPDIDCYYSRFVPEKLLSYPGKRKIRVVSFNPGIDVLHPAPAALAVQQPLRHCGVGYLPVSQCECAGVANRNDSRGTGRGILIALGHY